MNVRSIEFFCSALSPKDYPKDGLPEVAFAGRSNVGKSTLLNVLLNRKNLARTSSTPGRTRSIDFFRLNHRFYLVDLPGYGYSALPQKRKEHLARLIEGYVTRRRTLCGVVHLLDIRHPPSRLDHIFCGFLLQRKVAALLVATKADKVSRMRQTELLAQIRGSLQAPDSWPLVAFSSRTRQGKAAIWRHIQEMVEQGATPRRVLV